MEWVAVPVQGRRRGRPTWALFSVDSALVRELGVAGLEGLRERTFNVNGTEIRAKVYGKALPAERIGEGGDG